MAKKSMINKQQLEHITDARSVADPTPIFANSAFAVSVSESWHTKARSRALKRLAGKHEQRRLITCTSPMQSLIC